MRTGATLPWEWMDITEATLKPLRGTHSLWSRLMDGEHIFTVMRNGVTPRDGDGGYRSIDAALRQKGML
jgi:hypothetical protein